MVFDHMMHLQERGVPIVPHEIKGDVLWMPYMEHPTLSDYLRNRIEKKDREAFIEVFMKLYAYILLSSEHTSDKENVLEDKQESRNWGPILRKAYIDMIPINCFYVDGEYCFFDQEFVKENYPAKYILFRALKYTYHFYPDAEECVPLKEMKDTYEMIALWSVFEEEENRFVAGNRQQDVYKHFLEWSSVDRSRMGENAEYLARG